MFMHLECLHLTQSNSQSSCLIHNKLRYVQES